MKNELTEKQEEERQKLLYWWEDLTDEERTKLLKGYVWEGTIKDRYIKLKEMDKVWKKEQEEISSECNNCGEKIKREEFYCKKCKQKESKKMERNKKACEKRRDESAIRNYEKWAKSGYRTY